MDQQYLIDKKLQPLRIDAMPADVATEMLTNPTQKMSGTFRRVCQRARASYYVSTNTPKTTHDFSRRSIGFVVRQLSRTIRRIRMAQTLINKIQVENLKAQAVQNIMLPLLSIGRALQAELANRESNIVALAAAKRLLFVEPKLTAEQESANREQIAANQAGNAS